MIQDLEVLGVFQKVLHISLGGDEVRGIFGESEVGEGSEIFGRDELKDVNM